MKYEENKQVEALFLAGTTVFLVCSGTKGLIMACCGPMDTLDTAYFSVNAITSCSEEAAARRNVCLGAFIFYENHVGPLPHSLELALNDAQGRAVDQAEWNGYATSSGL